MTFAEILFWLIAGHALCDFALQTTWMSESKNPWGGSPAWLHAMLSHCVLHGAAVAAVTGSVSLGAAEIAAHFAADSAKCRKLWGIHVDQALHIFCKVAWAAAVSLGIINT